MISAYLQTYKGEERPRFVLTNFRKFYPNSSVYLVSDAGDNFSKLAQEFNCTYHHAPENVGISALGYDKQQVLVWLDRVFNACRIANTEYLLYLEDDVLIRRPINVCRHWVLAGIMENQIPPLVMHYLNKKYGTYFNATLYGASGGTIYHVPTFLRIYRSVVQLVQEEFDYILHNLGVRFGFLDMFMPVFYMAHGYDYSLNTEMIEPHRVSFWKQTNHAIVHGDGIYA